MRARTIRDVRSLLQPARAAMADMLDGAPEFVDLVVAAETIAVGRSPLEARSVSLLNDRLVRRSLIDGFTRYAASSGTLLTRAE